MHEQVGRGETNPPAPIRDAVTDDPQADRPFLYSLSILGTTFALLVTGLVAALVYQFYADQAIEVRILPERDQEELRRECRDLLEHFDATRDHLVHLTPDETAVYHEIRALLDEVGKAGQRQGNRHFDTVRLMKQIETSGLVGDWEEEERDEIVKLLSQAMRQHGVYDHYEIVGIVDPAATPELRLVYTLGQVPNEPADVVRLWVARSGDNWRIYDMETVGIARKVSEQWIGELRTAEGNFDVFADALRRHTSYLKEAANGKLPEQDADSLIASASGVILSEHERDDFFRSIILALQHLESRKGVRHFETQIRDPESMPAVLLASAWAHTDTDPARALAYADRYEALLGPCPKLSRARCDIYARLGDRDQLIAEYRTWLRLTPNDEQALLELALALPSERKGELLSHLAHVEHPDETALNLLNGAKDRDLATTEWLASHLEVHAPQSVAAHIAAGSRAEARGEYEQAADHYLKALESNDIDSDDRFDYALKYINIMGELGRFAEAMRQVPNRRQMIDWELEEWLDSPIRSDEEYRQMIELGLADAPDDRRLVQSLAQLQMKLGEFEQAEKLLRSQIARVESKAERAESQEVYSLRYLLAQIHYYRREYQEAIATFVTPSNGFAKVVDMAISDVDPEAVENILTVAPVELAGKPGLEAARAWSLAHRGEWQQAFDLYARLLQAHPDVFSYQHDDAFALACGHTGRWIEGFDLLPDKVAALRRLVHAAVEAGEPDAVAQLCQHYEPEHPADAVPVFMQLEGAWALEDYGEYIKVVKRALDLPPGNKSPSRESLRVNLFAALLHERRFAEANVLAEELVASERTAWAKAIVAAAQGSPLALDHALKMPPESDLTRLYEHPSVGTHFLEERFRPLHERSPVAIPLGVDELVGVLYLDSPLSLSSDAIIEATNALGPPATISPRQPVDPRITSAMVIQFAEGSVWLATGSGWHAGDWKSRVRRSPYASLANADTPWLAVGVTGWNEKVRDPLLPMARQLAVALTGEQTTHVCAASRKSWQHHQLFAADPRLVAAWTATGSVETLHHNPISPIVVPRPLAYEAAEGEEPPLDSRLRKTLYQWRQDSNQPLTVWARVAHPMATAPLELKVRSIEYREEVYELTAEVTSQSILLPELKPGLPMKFGEHAIEAFQIGEAPITR